MSEKRERKHPTDTDLAVDAIKKLGRRIRWLEEWQRDALSYVTDAYGECDCGGECEWCRLVSEAREDSAGEPAD